MSAIKNIKQRKGIKRSEEKEIFKQEGGASLKRQIKILKEMKLGVVKRLEEEHSRQRQDPEVGCT